MANKAIIAGASGLIGRELSEILWLQDGYDEVLLLVRRELKIRHSKLKQLIVDFDHLEEHADSITGHAIFCCLGSTRKKTPDLNDYRKIDHDYPLRLAEIACKNGVEQFHLVSSLGADAASSNFYTKMKGETEADIQNVGLRCLHIYRPSLLTGERAEGRLTERVFIFAMKLIDPLLWGNLKKYRSIPAAAVAVAMYNQSMKKTKGVFIHPSDQIKKLL